MVFQQQILRIRIILIFSIIFTFGTRAFSFLANNAISQKRLSIVAGADGAMPQTLGFSDGVGDLARFNNPRNMVQDGNGNIFLSDENNHTIRKITSAGVVTTFAGKGGVSGTANGVGDQARFYIPKGLTFDSSGNLYVVDSGNLRVRKITAAGSVTNFTTTTFSNVSSALGSITYNPNLNIFYVGDGKVIKKIDSGGNLTNFSGNAFGSTPMDGDAATAVYSTPMTLLFDTFSGFLFVFDGEIIYSAIRKVDVNGNSTIFAGSYSQVGNTNGTGTAARFDAIVSVVKDSSNNFIFLQKSAIRKITQSAVVTTLFSQSLGGAPYIDGSSSTARMSTYNYGSVFLNSNELLFSDYSNHAIRKFNLTTSVMSTYSGPNNLTSGTVNGPPINSRFHNPTSMAFDNNNKLLVVDESNLTIRKIDIGTAVSLFTGQPNPGSVNSVDGSSSTTILNNPKAIAVNSLNEVFISQYCGVTKVNSVGTTTRFSGAYNFSGCGDANGASFTARFNTIVAIAVDNQNNLYVADDYVIKKVLPDGSATVLAGTKPFLYNGIADGQGTAAKFGSITDMVIDKNGDLYVSEALSHTIRKITSSGTVTTIAGSAGLFGDQDGVGAQARFFKPSGIAVDSNLNLYVADQKNQTIRKITPAGVVTTVIGQPGKSGILRSSLPARLDFIKKIIVRNGKLYFTVNNSVYVSPLP